MTSFCTSSKSFIRTDRVESVQHALEPRVPLASAERLALSCGPTSLGKTRMLGTTAALGEANKGSEA
jgi:hypothetical protein